MAKTQVIRQARPGSERASAGFTLIELLLVLVILATLAAIVIPRFAGRSEQAKETAAKTQISNFKTVLDSYEVDTGGYPDSLQALVQNPGNVDGWRGPYMPHIPNDPWGQPYIYEYPGKHNQGGYDIMSTGPDKRAGTDDDITNWVK